MKKRACLLVVIVSLVCFLPTNLNSEFNFDNNTLQTSSATTDYLVSSLPPHKLWHFAAGGDVNSVAISADGNYIVAGTSNEYIHLFDKSSSVPLWSYQADEEVTSVAISADGKYIIAGSDDFKVYFFNNSIETSKKAMWIYDSLSFSITSVVISSNGRYAAAINDGESLYIFDTNNVSDPLYREFIDPSFTSLAISSDGNHIACGKENDIIQYYNTTYKEDKLWENAGSPAAITISSIQLSSDGSYVVAGRLSVVKILNRSGSQVLSNNTNGYINSVDMSSDGNYFVSGNILGDFSLFSKSSSIPLWSHSVCSEIYKTVLSSDGNYLAYGGNASSGKAMVYFFSKESSTPLFTYEVDESGTIQSMSMSSDGRYLVVGVSGVNNRIYLFEVHSGNNDNLWVLIIIGGIVIAGITGGIAIRRRRPRKRKKLKKKRIKRIPVSMPTIEVFDVLKEVGHKNELLQKFQEAKSAQSISPIKGIFLTSISTTLIEKASKLILDPPEMKEFLEEMLALPPIYRNNIIDRMLLVQEG